MNERIKEMWEEATLSHWPRPGKFTAGEYDNHLEKFAELIVRECMRMCDVAAIGYESHGHVPEANGCYSAKEYIEEHFGVEE